MTRFTRCARLARSYTRWIIGLPPNETSGLPGSRVEPYRAGITTTTVGELMIGLSYIVPEQLLL
jgi:hypothetical protein